MVETALKQNTASHMWLFYINYFVEEILKNIEYEKNAEGEFVNMYEYYLYDIFSTYKKWITYPTRSDNYTIEYRSDRGPNIIQNAIDSFVSTIYNIQKSDKLRDTFKNKLGGIFINTYFELAICNKSEINNYVRHFKKCLKRKIIESNDKKVDLSFIDFLKMLIYNPFKRNIWGRGAKYVLDGNNMLIFNDFKEFLYSFLPNSK